MFMPNGPLRHPAGFGDREEQSQRPKTEGRKPCPFCASNKTRVKESQTESATYQTVVCENCGAEGPSELRESEAINMWNTRRTF